MHKINGLRITENPVFGGWGGRFKQSKILPSKFEDGDEVKDYNIFINEYDASFPQTCWIEEMQKDFAARTDWCINSYKDSNHAPKVNTVDKKLNIKAEKGESITLKADVTDPDGDNVSVKWWEYYEADTYKGEVELNGAESSEMNFKVPEDAEPGDDIYIILQGTDSGKPNMVNYKRIIITVY